MSVTRALSLIEDTLQLLKPYLTQTTSMAQSTSKKDDNNQFLILGMGNPLLDISNFVSLDFLKKYEIRPDNAILAEAKHLPMYEELSGMKGTEYIAGGSTLNTIRVAQWMSQSDSSVAAYVGCIGKDKFGDLLKACTKKDKVTCEFQIHESMPTGTCAVCIVDKERSLIANLSAANEFDKNFMKMDAVQKLLDAVPIVYTAGFFVTASFDSMLLAAQHCLETNKVFALNFSAEFVVSAFKEPILKLLPYVTHVFTNKEECKTFANSNQMTYSDMSDLAAQISLLDTKRSDCGRYVIVTQGSENVVVAHNGKVTVYPIPKLDVSKIVDVNGAGDAFAGGFLSQIMRSCATKSKVDIGRCVKAATYAAQYILQTSGTSLKGVPDFK